MEKFETKCLIIGGGVAGIAIARSLSKEFKDIYLIEKNNSLGLETSSRNSEVIHAGIYYQPNSLKSKLCLRGKNLLYEYLSKNNISFNKCGKLIVSSNESEAESLDKIKNNAFECGIDDLSFDTQIIKQYPFLKSHTSLFSPSTGIFDSGSFISSLEREFEKNGGTILFGNKCMSVEKEDSFFNIHVIDLNNNIEFIIQTKTLINAAGISSVEIANSILEEKKYQVDYIKGDYYNYKGKEKLEHLIYPLPGKDSLGIHATIDLGKGIRFGPSAYKVESEDYSINSDKKEDFYNSVISYWPKLKREDLLPDYSGIRAKIKNFDDFEIKINNIDDKIIVNILGYISPGLTSSLALGEYIQSAMKDF